MAAPPSGRRSLKRRIAGAVGVHVNLKEADRDLLVTVSVKYCPAVAVREWRLPGRSAVFAAVGDDYVLEHVIVQGGRPVVESAHGYVALFRDVRDEYDGLAHDFSLPAVCASNPRPGLIDRAFHRLFTNERIPTRCISRSVTRQWCFLHMNWETCLRNQRSRPRICSRSSTIRKNPIQLRRHATTDLPRSAIFFNCASSGPRILKFSRRTSDRNVASGDLKTFCFSSTCRIRALNFNALGVYCSAKQRCV